MFEKIKWWIKDNAPLAVVIIGTTAVMSFLVTGHILGYADAGHGGRH